MDVRRLRHFLALAEELHFGRAAARAHIEQSPLSRSISQLEDELGVQLFIRSRQGTKLTPAGQVLRSHANQILIAIERAARAVAEVEGLPAVLRIGLSDGLAHPRLSVLFQRWREADPPIRLRILELPSFQQHEALLTERIDVGFSFGAARVDGLLVESLWHDPVVVAAPQGHVLAQAAKLTFAAIADHPLVLCHTHHKPGLRAQLDTMLQARGISPETVEQAETLAGMIVKIGAGCGLGFLDASHAQTLLRPDVVMVPLAEGGAYLTTYALTKADRYDALTPAIEKFLALARAVS